MIYYAIRHKPSGKLCYYDEDGGVYPLEGHGVYVSIFAEYPEFLEDLKESHGEIVKVELKIVGG